MYELYEGPDPVMSYTEYPNEQSNPIGWQDGCLDGYHEFEITSPAYYVLSLTVTDTDWYDSSGSTQNHSDTETYLFNVFDLDITGPTYIALNNDDDNENEIMDFTENTSSLPEEDDLGTIAMWLQPYSCVGEVELKVMGEDSGNVWVWDNEDKTGKVLPRDGVPSYEKWKIQWDVPDQVLYKRVEGRDSAKQTSLAWNYVINDDDYVTNGTEAYSPVILEVDVDIDGVKDSDQEKPMFDPEITEENSPGAFIHLGDTVKIDCLEVFPENENLVPVDSSHSVLLMPTAGWSKVDLWRTAYKTGWLGFPRLYSTRTGMDQDLLDGLYISGETLSTVPRDITLALMWKSYKDEIKATVVDLEEIWFCSDNAITSPVAFEGGRYELDSPCLASGAEPSLIIPHCNVRSPSDPSVIVDHSVDLCPVFSPLLVNSDLPIDKRDLVKWSKVAGPASGYLDDDTDLFAEYNNPKKGGVYEIEFEVPGWDWTTTHGLIHLPLAGPDATTWTLGELAQTLNVGDYLFALDVEIDFIPVKIRFDHLAAWYVESRELSWTGEANQSGGSPCHVFGTNKTVTIDGIVVDRAKFQNIMFGAMMRRAFPTSTWNTMTALTKWASYHGYGTPDSPCAMAAYEASRILADGIPLHTVMNMYGYIIQEPDGKAREYWPSEYPYIGGIQRPPLLDDPDAVLDSTRDINRAIEAIVTSVWYSL